MAITKKIFVDGETVIMAEDLNAWQDELIRLDSGKYEKPASGIPKTDLAEAVQTSLEKADTALQPSDVDAELSDSSTNPVQNKVITAALDGKAPVIYETASGAVASFPNGAGGLPIKSLEVNIEPLQSGSGDPSPENIRPISGWTGCNISHSGEDTSNPTVMPIIWQTEAGTVYGGTLDATNGVLTVNRRLEIVDGGKILRASTTVGGNYFAELKIEYFVNIQEIVVTNAYPVVNVVSALGIRLTPDKTHIYVYDNRFVNLQTAKDIADTTNIQVLYALTTPVTYQLTPQEVATLLGVNNIWADCGPVAVEYPADTKLYIDSKIAAAVAALS